MIGFIRSFKVDNPNIYMDMDFIGKSKMDECKDSLNKVILVLYSTGDERVLCVEQSRCDVK